MRKSLSIAAVLLAAGGILLARGGMRPACRIVDAPAVRAEAIVEAPREEPQGERRLINTKQDLMGPVRPGDTAIFMVGDFAAQHNGTVITCDSAVRYSDMRLEFFGNVLINKNTTYIYGDRVLYDGEINEARIFSELIKVVDGDAVLYTHEFFFDTKANIGRFDGGGVLVNGDNVLEATRGYYYTDTKELIGVDHVEMHNDDYDLRGDSVIYDLATEGARFFERTYIWNRDGDFLSADRGSYIKADSLYRVTRNGYILTAGQEVWSDSIDYFRPRGHAILRGNIQLDDTEYEVMGFGDYGEYWKHPGDALLTCRPAMVSYDLSQGDSLFMRADTIRLFTIVERDESASPAQSDSLKHSPHAESDAVSDDGSSDPSVPGDTTSAASGPHRGGLQVARAGQEPDGDDASGDRVPAVSADTLPHADSVAADTLRPTPAEQKALLREAARREKAERKAEAQRQRKARLEEIAIARQEKATTKLLAVKAREERRLAARRLKAEARLRARQERARRRGKPIPVDSSELSRIDSLLGRNSAEQDSLQRLLTDEWVSDSTAFFAPAVDTAATGAGRDTIYRLMKGYRDVRIYRSDFQAVCDSMTAITTDSTLHLYIDPVLWNQNNQVTSEVMDIYTLNRQLDHADFVGTPMMVSQLDTLHYNQIKGKEMTAYFVDNAIARNVVNGNALTLYYSQDGEPAEVVMLGVVESGGIVFYFEDKRVVRITWTTSPTYNFYPMDKIPEEQELFLPDFKWEGARRPAQREVFDRRIRSSQRAFCESLSRPDFPIRRRIDRYRGRLIEQKQWIDRADRVDDATVEWMRSLGYTIQQPAPASEPIVMMDPEEL